MLANSAHNMTPICPHSRPLCYGCRWDRRYGRHIWRAADDVTVEVIDNEDHALEDLPLIVVDPPYTPWSLWHPRYHIHSESCTPSADLAQQLDGSRRRLHLRLGDCCWPH